MCVCACVRACMRACVRVCVCVCVCKKEKEGGYKDLAVRGLCMRCYMSYFSVCYCAICIYIHPCMCTIYVSYFSVPYMCIYAL